MDLRGDGMNQDRLPRELEGLFTSYREVLPDVDASAAFTPGLWSRIDQRRGYTYSLRRIARGFVTAAAAITLMLSAALWIPNQLGRTNTNGNYVDVLADDGQQQEEVIYLALAAD